MFKIEVQADSIPQLADRLLALGAQLSIPAEVGLQRTISAIMPELAEQQQQQQQQQQQSASVTVTAEPAQRKPRATKPKPEPEVEAAQAEAEAQVESMTDAARNEEPPEVEAEVESGIVAADLDFDKDVAPHVLDLVGRKGREAMTSILDQFGAARASEIPENQWPELLGKIKEAVG